MIPAYVLRISDHQFSVECSKKIVSVFLLCCTCIWACPAQSSLTFPSPNAASLGKYGDYQVGYYTGVPAIGVPLFEIKECDLNIPVALSYHAAGVKVNDIPSWVGTNWSLTAGGVITRVTAGLPDDFLQNSPKRKVGYIHALLDLNANGYPSYPCEFIRDRVTTGEIDTEPDVFYFNLPGQSGKFYYSHDVGGFIHDTKQYTKMEPVWDGQQRITGWNIEAEDGTRYRFTEQEKTESIQVGNESESIGYVTSAWYLTSIEGPNGYMSFGYQKIGVAVQRQNSVSEYMHALEFPLAGLTGGSSFTSGETITTSETTYLSEITTSNSRTTFHISETQGRGSTPNQAYKLDSIRVTQGTSSKTFQLRYFLHSNRLFLESVQQKNALGEVLPPHVFEYNLVTSLPPSFESNDFDHWGFYNGANNGPNSGIDGLPEILTYNAGQGTGHYRYGANREPNGLVMYAGSLTKIIYPTGGSTQFAFEPNDYSNYMIGPYATPVSWRIGAPLAPVVFSFSNLNPVVPTPIQYPYPVLVRYYLSCTASSGCELPNICDQIFSLGLSNGTLQQDGRFGFVLPAGQSLDITRFTAGALPTGGIGGCDYSVSFTATVNPIESETIAMAGGLRIAQIQSTDSAGSVLTRRFSYQDNPLLSNGILGNRPLYRLAASFQFNGGAAISSLRQSTTIEPLSYAQGSHIGYSTVTETRSDGALTRYGFTNFNDFPDTPFYNRIFVPSIPLLGGGTTCSFFDFPYSMSYARTATQEPIRGLPSLIEYIKGTEVISREENTYVPDPSYAVSSRGFSIKSYGQIGGVSINFAEQYQLGSFWAKKAETTHTTFENGVSSVKKINYFYDNPAHTKVTRTTEVLSDGSIKTTKTKYNPDYYPGTIGPVIVPMEQQVWLNSNGTDKIVSGTLTSYVGIRPLNKYSLEISQPVTSLDNESKTGIYYNHFLSDSRYKLLASATYNSCGLRTYSKVNDVMTSYLWGYSDNHPIAEISNALPEQVVYTSFEDIVVNTTTTSSVTGRRSYTDSYQIVLPSAGTYALTYWKKVGTSNWEFVQAVITSNTSIGGPGILLDEVRLYPTVARMKTYTYEPGIGISSIADENGLISQFEYDGFGRLKTLRDEKGNILKDIHYHFKK
jgi:hypothetical protein